MGGMLGAMWVNWVGVFKWHNEMGVNLDATLVNQIEYHSGPLKWVQIWVQYQ
jgi:hypothetical protein